MFDDLIVDIIKDSMKAPHPKVIGKGCGAAIIALLGKNGEPEI